MPNNKNIWFRIFNFSPVEKEEWLDPADAILEGIENEIYVKEKKKRFILFRFLGAVLFLL